MTTSRLPLAQVYAQVQSWGEMKKGGGGSSVGLRCLTMHAHTILCRIQLVDLSCVAMMIGTHKGVRQVA